MSRHLDVMTAKDNVVKTALRVIRADHYDDASDPYADAEAEHASELLALAARELVRAMDALPEDEQPIGWTQAADTTEEEAAHVLHCAGRDGGCSPGDFHAQLLALFIAADPDDTKRLALAFPGYAAAINLLYAGQVAQLQRIAEG